MNSEKNYQIQHNLEIQIIFQFLFQISWFEIEPFFVKMSFLIEITWMLMNLLEQWLMSHFIIRILIEFIDWIFKSLGRRLNSMSLRVALGWEPRHRNERKIKILWPPFQLTISDTLRNWTSKIEIWPRITAFISEIFFSANL